MTAPQPEPFTPMPLDRLRQEYDVSFSHRVSDQEAAYKDLAQNFDFKGIKEQIFNAMSDVGLRTEKCEVSVYGADSFEVHFEGNNGDPSLRNSFSLSRTFTRHGNGELEVHHDLFKLPESAQGKGTSKRVLSMFYEQYKRMGCRKSVWMPTLISEAIHGRVMVSKPPTSRKY